MNQKFLAIRIGLTACAWMVATATCASLAAQSASPRSQLTQKPESKPKPKPRLEQDQQTKLADLLRPAINQVVTQLDTDGDYPAAMKAIDALFDQVVAFSDARDNALFRDAALARRLIHLLKDAEIDTRQDLLRYCIADPDLARAVAFLAKPGKDNPEKMLAVLDQLRTQREKTLKGHASLAAAICAVHDVPFSRRINEDTVTSPDPVALFDFFVANEKRMYFGLQQVPAELLVYVVDSTASIDEMNWAINKYAGNRNVGALFFDIKYDHDALQKGTTKKVTIAGFNLPNILKHGGVCADQAYFAASVGKAIGVPAVYTTGASADAGHAWVGFLQSDGQNSWWNFNSGRYEDYQGVRGSVMDPQTRKSIPDSYVSLLADFVTATELNRQAVAALNDAARRLIEIQKQNGEFDPPAPKGFEVATRRKSITADALALLEAGLNGCAGYAEGWFTVSDLAADGKLSLDDKKKWASVLHRLCGERYPDFYLAILEPMIETVDDIKEQNALWNAAFKNFQSRLDLAASVRMSQAKMWLEQNEPAKAGQCYEDVILRYANAGPFVIKALVEAEKILRGGRDARKITVLYERAWSQMKKPKDMAGMFMVQSNWYRVGRLYADRLADSGESNEASKVRAAIAVK